MFHSASNFAIYGGNFTVISSDETTKIYQWLNAPDCSANYVTAADKRLPGTGQWIFDLAGSGKTVLM
ncbi:hypothetical protein LENED_009389 [Lentinula edodes]|uniref:Uncharacterized protein n=1 Tax=Lentinula edodes TaxID=5353 RepID=A0A1Q3EJM0_LENED|nr:hypothetical protein LENED_009389 [Lentinula edodes]